MTPLDATALREVVYILLAGAFVILVFALFFREVLTHPVVEDSSAAWGDIDERDDIC
jgi:hypothetical protein